jgi:hypothetical protein
MNNKQNNTNNKFGRVLAVPSLCELYPGICLTTEEKARKNLSQGSQRDVSHDEKVMGVRHATDHMTAVWYR